MAKALTLTIDGITTTTLPAPLGMYQGEDTTLTCTFTTGVITGLSITFTLRNRRGGTTQFTKTVGSGIVINSASVCTITILAADTSALDYGEYEYDIERTDSGNVTVWATGVLNILPR